MVWLLFSPREIIKPILNRVQKAVLIISDHLTSSVQHHSVEARFLELALDFSNLPLIRAKSRFPVLKRTL